MDLSVIIVTWNSEKEIGPCLRSVFAASAGLSVETFVIDNASQDKTKEAIEKVLKAGIVIPSPQTSDRNVSNQAPGFLASDQTTATARNDETNNVTPSESKPGVKTIWNGKNLGFAAAVNQGIAQSSGDFILLLNPDCAVAPGSLKAAVDYLRRRSDVGIVGGKISNADGTVQSSVRRFPTFLDQAVILSKMHNFFPEAVARYMCEGFDYAKEQEVDQVRGAFFAFGRKLLEKIGPLDAKNFFVWFEEVDYCRRARDAGFKVMYVPFAAATHVGGASFGQEKSVTKQRWLNRSMRNYFRKHGTAGDVFVLTILSLLSLPLSAGVQLLKIKPRKYV